MTTPDLAGLLAKPARRPRPAPARIDDTEPPNATDTELTTTPPAQTTALDEDNLPEAPARTDAPPTVETPAETGSTLPANAKKPRRKAPPPPAEAPSQAQRQYLQSKAFNLPRSIHRRLSDHAATENTTQTALILTALNQTHEELAAVLAAQHTDAPYGGELFDIPQRKRDREPTVQTTIRLTDRQLEAIDGLVTKFGTNRSQLVSAALSIYLP
jgi:hypothetical protein